MFPTPKDSVRHRAVAEAAGGRLQFPLLVDSNSGATMYESDAIVRYLYQTYGGGAQPPKVSLGGHPHGLWQGWSASVGLEFSGGQLIDTHKNPGARSKASDPAGACC